jgi:hypothetical protein
VKRDTGLPKGIRDGVLLAVGSFMLLFMTYTGRVYPLLIGAALTILGIPTGVRAAEIIRGTSSRGSSSSRARPLSSQSSRSQSSTTRFEGATDDQRPQFDSTP